MNWRTHVAIGANAIWIIPYFGKVDSSILILLPIAAFASLLPDIDAASAKIHYAGSGILGIFRGAFHGKYFHHRGIMHSLLAALLLLLILIITTSPSYPLLPYVAALAYISHPIIDGFNTGVGFLYPFVYKRYTLIPRALTFRVNSPADTLLMFLGIAGLLIFFVGFGPTLMPH